MTTKLERRLKIKAGVRGKISGTTERPRLTVFRSNKQIYAQVIDDTTGKTLAAASSLKLDVKAPKKEIAAKVGELIAKGAQEAGVQTVVFDRNGYLYHGRIKELAAKLNVRPPFVTLVTRLIATSLSFNSKSLVDLTLLFAIFIKI